MENLSQQIMDLVYNYAPLIIMAVLTLVIGFWIIGLVTHYFGKAMEKRGVDATVQPFLRSLVNVGLKVLLLISIAGIFGMETTSFVAAIGAAAFAIGLALQGSLGHFASGVLILTFKPYKVGDLVEINGNVGTVEAIQVFNTLLLTPDNKRVIIPNGVVTSGVIINISGQGKIRVDTTFGISYADDIDKAREVIQKVIDACPQVIKDIPADIFVSELADSSVNFAVRPWANSAHYWDVYFYLHEQIKKAFDKEGISIPFPQRDLHMYSKS